MENRTIQRATITFLNRGNKTQERNIAELLEGSKKHEVREAFNNNDISFTCLECGQRLHISISINDELYLKHYESNNVECILKSPNIKLVEEANIIRHSKESPRHKFLKNKLISLLQQEIGVTNVKSEEWVLKNGMKCRPDVYCEFSGKKIIFEIQISPISLRYILHRKNFYLSQNMYLIWLLDEFDKYKQDQWIKDLKYLNNQQNLFEINEYTQNTSTLFNCHYKEIYIDSNVLKFKWKTKLTSLNQLFFDERNYQVYLKDFNSVFHQKSQELKLIKINIEARLAKQRELEEEINSLKQKRAKEKEKLGELEDKASDLQQNVERYSGEIDRLNAKLKEINPQIDKNFTGVLESVRFLGNPIHNDVHSQVLNKKKTISELFESIQDYKSLINYFTSFPVWPYLNNEYRRINPKTFKFSLENRYKELIILSEDEQETLFFTPKPRPIPSPNHLAAYIRNHEKFIFLFDLDTICIDYEESVKSNQRHLQELEFEVDVLNQQLIDLYREWLKSELEKAIAERDIAETKLRVTTTSIEYSQERLEKISRSLAALE